MKKYLNSIFSFHVHSYQHKNQSLGNTNNYNKWFTFVICVISYLNNLLFIEKVSNYYQTQKLQDKLIKENNCISTYLTYLHIWKNIVLFLFLWRNPKNIKYYNRVWKSYVEWVKPKRENLFITLYNIIYARWTEVNMDIGHKACLKKNVKFPPYL